MTPKHSPYHAESSLFDAADALGKRALQLGLIKSFVVRHFVDSNQFYIPDEYHEPLTAERAYLQFKTLIDQSAQ